MKKYTHIFFDLDRTLWDYDANATETLHDLVDRYKVLNGHAITKKKFVEEFFHINEELWERFDKGLIDKTYIRTTRFPLLFRKLDIDKFRDIDHIQNDFITECPQKGHLIDGAEGIIKKLYEKYPLYIITNGFEEIQHTKLEFSGLGGYFQAIVTSELADVQKPDPSIFEFAINLAQADRSTSVMIGDNFGSDIIGAQKAGIDQIFFNPGREGYIFKPTYEISHLDQLSDILL